MAVTIDQVQAGLQLRRSRVGQYDMRRELQDTLQRALDRATMQFNGFRAGLDKISNDPTLSPAGQVKASTAAAKQWASELAWLTTTVTEANKDVARLDTVLFAPPARPAGNEVVQYLREKEIRDAFCDANQNERDVAYLDAMNRGDGETIRALLDAPMGSWVSKDMQTRLQRERAGDLNPGAFATWQELSLLRDELVGLQDHVTQWLNGLNPPVVSRTTVVTGGPQGPRTIIA